MDDLPVAHVPVAEPAAVKVQKEVVGGAGFNLKCCVFNIFSSIQVTTDNTDKLTIAVTFFEVS